MTDLNKEIDEKNKKFVSRFLMIGGLIIILSITALWLAVPKKENLTIPTNPNEIILNYAGMIDGYDSASGTIIDPVNLWSDYNDRKFAGTVQHGEKVTLIKRVGDGILIEKKDGKRGWVTYFFIKGLK